ncbi:MAG: SRPBCC domain-containing protein [Sandaracinaceae bacterium]|nr:SRPBCC domain-containing protein [Sandaracinaceae bacterium]
MGNEAIRTSATISALPQRIYEAWLDAREHGLFTGGAATCDARVGGKFSAWDGYIEGENLVLEPGKRIVQAWRSSDFPKSAGASRLEVLFEKNGGGTKVTILHSEIPGGQGAEYKRGWVDYYFTPMKTYFGAKPASRTATKKAVKASSTKARAAKTKSRAAKGKK